MIALSPEMLQLLNRKTFAEFFAGIGLVRAGLEPQGWTISFANDIDPRKYAMYKGHFGERESHFILGDIHDLQDSDLPTVTLATASFPCKDLSLAGSREGLNGEHSAAFWGFIQALDRMGERKPPVVMLENVTGFLNSNKGKDLEQALLALNQRGYRIDAFILNAVDFVPQSRERLFIMGLSESVFPVKDMNGAIWGLQSHIRPKALTDFILRHPDIQWNIRSVPFAPHRHQSLEDIIEDLPKDSPVWWSAERAEYLLNQMSRRHRIIAEQMIDGEQWSYGTIFRRMRKGKSTAELRTDGIAGCLRTPAGGSAKQIVFKAGRGQYFARLLTPEECARLMGIGEYKITVSFDDALLGFGDAVCVHVINWIAEHYLHAIIEECINQIPPAAVLMGG
jgi:DNA (cytosine-5)-methyltransferase 1